MLCGICEYDECMCIEIFGCVEWCVLCVDVVDLVVVVWVVKVLV